MLFSLKFCKVQLRALLKIYLIGYWLSILTQKLRDRDLWFMIISKLKISRWDAWITPSLLIALSYTSEILWKCPYCIKQNAYQWSTNWPESLYCSFYWWLDDAVFIQQLVYSNAPSIPAVLKGAVHVTNFWPKMSFMQVWTANLKINIVNRFSYNIYESY
jgi:hypothetical protein